MTGLRWWTLDIADRIAVLTFVRPPRNWMSLAAMTEPADLLAMRADRPEMTVWEIASLASSS